MNFTRKKSCSACGRTFCEFIKTSPFLKVLSFRSNAELQRVVQETSSKSKAAKKRNQILAGMTGSTMSILPSLLYGSSAVVPTAEVDIEADGAENEQSDPTASNQSTMK